ncbi:MAG: protein phosphatase CheZ, partial [Rhodospirillaceae bacterium]
MDRLSQLTEDEFEYIEEEISRTAKGRAFLRRFRRQALGAATEEIRAMLEEFRLSWRQQSQAIEAANRISVLRQELIEMAASIERARREIAALQPADADNNKIISATSELDAIVISTERASFEILNAAERLMELSSSFREGGADPELCSALDGEVTTIFTACSFQDLTGQRTSKVVNALRYIEQRINAMISIWGATEDGHPPIPDPLADKREDAHLLQGPQLEGKGVSQSDVDAMFSFDAPPASEALDAVSKLLMMAGAAGGDDDESEPEPVEDEEEDDASSHFNQADIDALLSGAPPPTPAPAAKTKQDQSDIDAMFDAPAPKPAPKPAAKASQGQSDIDAMFDAPAPKPAPKPAAKASQGQSDIDAMFDAPAPKPAPKPAAKASQGQSDIDAMFDAPAPKPAPKPAAK